MGPTDSTTQPLREALFRRVRTSMAFSDTRAGVYAWTNRILRFAMIVCAALAAGGSSIPSLKASQPYLSIAVVALTGIDTFSQPATKWKAHYRYNDAFISAETELEGIPSQDAGQLQTFRKKMDDLDAAYRKEVLL